MTEYSCRYFCFFPIYFFASIVYEYNHCHLFESNQTVVEGDHTFARTIVFDKIIRVLFNSNNNSHCVWKTISRKFQFIVQKNYILSAQHEESIAEFNINIPFIVFFFCIRVHVELCLVTLFLNNDFDVTIYFVLRLKSTR